MKKINEDNLPRVHKHVKYNDSKDGLEDVLSTGKVLKKDPKRNSVLVYVLSGRSKGNRKWIPKEAIIEPEPTVNKEVEFVESFEMKEYEGEDEPSEGDITTSDYETFYQYGEVIIQPSAHDELEVLEYGAFFDKENWKRAVKYYMNREGFWPSVWYISDHGNPVLLDLEESKISTNLNKEVLMKDRVIRAIDSLIQEEVNKEVNPDVGSSVSSAGGLKVGDSVSWQDPQSKYERRIYGVVNMKDESKKELVVSSVADYADWGMGYLGQHYRIPYNEMNKFKVKKLSGVER